MQKRIFIEVNHPGQVHLIRYTYHELKNKGHIIWVACKNEPIICHLLQSYDIPYINLGNKGSGKWGKLLKQIIFDLIALFHVLKNRCTVGLGSSITNDHLDLILPWFKAIHLSDDDESAVPLICKFSYPFTTQILAPDPIQLPSFEKKLIRYNSYHELAYLHTQRFQPNPEVITKLGLTMDDTFFVLRFVALKGHHDDGQVGIGLSEKRELIQLLQVYGRVFITSEKQIEPEFESMRLPVAPEDIHSLLFYASGFFGDSQTMTTEAALLGTPAMKCNTFSGKLSIPNEIEMKYNLCLSFQPEDFNQLLSLAKIWMTQLPELKKEWHIKRERLMLDKLDLTSYLVNHIENF
ncbi:MAG: DUF354 domain-containing protein [Bacteroidetes bacterium]|nr:DUF354 domain-containing protein [Bacteroidota bacterium]